MEAFELLRCPRCGDRLHARDAGGVRLHGCLACGGVFLARADVDRLLAELPGEAVAESEVVGRGAMPVRTEAPLACPICRTTMERAHAKLAGVEVDRCAVHGTFYDRGELRKLAEALRATQFRAVAASPSPGGAPSAAPEGAKRQDERSSSGVADGAAFVVGVFAFLGDLLD